MPIVRANYETGGPDSFYRQFACTPYVNGVLQKLKGRFNAHFQSVSQIQIIMPINVASTIYSDIETISQFYNKNVDCAAMSYERPRWKVKWEQISEDYRPESSIDAVATMEFPKVFYPNIFKLLILYLHFRSRLLLQKIFSCV